MFVVKLDDFDQQVWARSFIPSAPSLPLLAGGALSASGDLAFSGIFSGALDFGSGKLDAGMGTDMFVVKLDASGATRWAKDIHGGTGFPFAIGVASIAPSGEVVLVGDAPNPVDFGAGVLTPAGSADAFVAKFGI